MSSPAVAASDPDKIDFTLEGCNLDHNPAITLPNGNGDFVCPTDAYYTSGNLGKGWNELDLVPHRVTLKNNGPTQTYSFVVAGDYKAKAGDAFAGWDFISALKLNAAKSALSCPALPTTGALTITPSGAGVGGADRTIYRLVTLAQQAATTCVYDYYQRLALGAHNFNGSSLQSNLWNQSLTSSGIGERRISLPVKEIAPQELRKTMSASQNSDHAWNVVKGASPAVLHFADTCSTATGSRSKAVAITVTWTKLAASPSGDITVVTNVYAKNPASRVITVQGSDEIRSGTTIVLDTTSFGPIDVPANTELPVLTHTTVVPAGTTLLNDVATATYTDKVTGIPVPGTTTATAEATVQSSGVVTNDTAVITDVESITGTDLSYSVDSFSGAGGSFSGGYVAGTVTKSPVTWVSSTQSGSGSVTFNKTVYVDQPSATTGTLADTATLVGSDGFTTHDDASVTIDSGALVSLTINKRRTPVTLEAQTFSFTVKNAANEVVATPSITIPGGTPTNVDIPATVSGLAPGTYTVEEAPNPNYPPSPPATVTINLPTCSGTANFVNTGEPAGARVQKITVPASATNWTFTLTGPDVPGGESVVVTAGVGYVNFASALAADGGVYTITETPLAGYDLTAVVGDFAGDSSRVTKSVVSRMCSFTLDLPADGGQSLSCTFTNTQQGTIIVEKQTDPDGAAGTFGFTGDASGSIGDNGQIVVSNLAPGTYTSTEGDPTPAFDLLAISCDDAASATASTVSLATRTATFKLDPGETVKCTFTNRQRGRVRVVKTVAGAPPSGTDAFPFQLRQGASASSAGTILESLTADAGNGGVLNFTTYLVPATTYQLCEVVMPGWMTTLGPPLYVVYNPSGDNSTLCTDFTVAAGQTSTFTIDNTRPPGGLARTIGFWKNWASCSGSNGKQTPVLDQTLALAGGHILIGDLDVDTCLEAVRILNKSTVDTGKKMASDPAFNLAAQLLAAKLNLVAGAGSCPAAVTAINDAQDLLALVDFDGVTHKKLTAAQAGTMNSLATTIDRYNNNTLC